MATAPTGRNQDPHVAGYEKLADVLTRAYEQAATGKGHHRHSVGQPFHEQPIVGLQELYGTGFALGQAAKKMEEAQRLDHDAAVRELLGAINYLAAAVIHMEQSIKQRPTTEELLRRHMSQMKCTCGPNEACLVCAPGLTSTKADDGWVEWDGTKNVAFSKGSLVEVQFRSGLRATDLVDRFYWGRDDSGKPHSDDIVRYRVLPA